MKPRLLDLFCGAGGATRGYQLAGFYVVGVDLKRQPRYVGDEFICDDAMTFPLDGFDVIHASPPCQQFTRARHLMDAQGRTSSALDLVAATRARLGAAGVPYVLENVPGAPVSGVVLCGSSFGLSVRRHRIFESNVLLFGAPCDHRAQGRPVGVYMRPNDDIPQGGRTARDLAEGQRAMGIDWMPWRALKEAIPPAYTAHLGAQIALVV